jgi:glyoxylase-like metal-dependent hydrolase (beta-lactamase superfamily II)
MPDDYETRLAEWKTKHGYVAPLGPESTADEWAAADAAQKAADAKLKGEDYCVLCGHGPQPISGMVLITRRDDPYIQIDDSEDEEDDDEDALPKVENRVRACPKCYAIEYGDEDELSEEDSAPEASNT